MSTLDAATKSARAIMAHSQEDYVRLTGIFARVDALIENKTGTRQQRNQEAILLYEELFSAAVNIVSPGMESAMYERAMTIRFTDISHACAVADAFKSDQERVLTAIQQVKSVLLRTREPV